MDALRLIKTARHALAEARDVPDVLLEAWQAGLLTEAVGGRIAEQDEGELAALGQLLSEAGAQVASCLEPSPESSVAVDWGGCGRASRLTGLGDLDPLLTELGRLLHEATETLVVLACGADAESLYWTCIDGVDAGADCKDLVAELHRAVRKAEAAQQPDGPSAPAQGPAGACPAPGGPAPATPGPVLVVPLEPPAASDRYRPPGPVLPGPAEDREPEDCRSASRPARSALTEASSSCICSSRLFGEADACGAAGPVRLGSCGVTGTSDHGADMRGPLRLGSAVFGSAV
ncbi:DUF6099 family protein [Kitasatospora sp. NPDC057223]|uniref:DUF6099 family protein n=1 Tax=Kitasatospora sp. NPDC057223 TaxID=3346055 RepID=UPI00364059C1